MTGVSPSGGSPSGGSLVQITGSNFTGATAVKFGGVSAPGFSVVNDSTINATTPSGSGVVDVTVTTAGGTSATNSTDHYDFVAAPAIRGVSPTHGPIAGGNSVTLSGFELHRLHHGHVRVAGCDLHRQQRLIDYRHRACREFTAGGVDHGDDAGRKQRATEPSAVHL